MRTLHGMLVAATIASLATFATPAALAAQKIPAGTWTGSIAPPNQAPLDATFDVLVSGDSTKITIHAGPRLVEAYDVKVQSDRLLFTFAPGNSTVKCTLMLKDDKSYSGDCLDDQGTKGVIVMRPPKA